MTARTAIAGAQRQVRRADMQPGCCKAGSVRAMQPAQLASRECSAGFSGKHWQWCSRRKLIPCSYRAQWGSRTSQQACLCTCTCTYVVLYACHPCSAVRVNMKARTTPAGYLRGTCRTESCTGCSTAKACGMRERALSSEREGRSDGESDVY